MSDEDLGRQTSATDLAESSDTEKKPLAGWTESQLLDQEPEATETDQEMSTDRKPTDSKASPTTEHPEGTILERLNDIIIPNNDGRIYRGLVLSNQLRVILVSDPETDKSAASLSVNVGSLSDPWDYQGLAHFLEHMLFIASSKYPEPNSYKDFIAAHGGSSNAYTSSKETSFFFDVACDHLAEALDRFLWMFLDPMFPPDRTANELYAVHHEFENSLTNDVNRTWRIRRISADPEHDFAKFEIGNKDTLKFDGNGQEIVAKFFEDNYSANIMYLAILGKESIDELEKLALQFSRIKNKDYGIYGTDTHPFNGQYLNRMVKIIPFKQMRRLKIFLPIGDYRLEPEMANALSYVSFLLGHEGPGSLLSVLKAHGYSTVLEVAHFTYPGFGFLDISVDLLQGITCNDKIIALLVQTFNMIKTKALKKDLYEECRKIREIRFHSRDKGPPIRYVRSLSSSLHQYGLRKVLSGNYLLDEFNADAIRCMFDLLTVDNLNINVISPIFKKNCADFSTDPIYKVQYLIEEIPAKWLQLWTSAKSNDKLTLPAPNEYIPDSLAILRPIEFMGTAPRLLHRDDTLKVWYLHDQIFQIPKAYYGLSFRSFLNNSTPHNHGALSIFLSMFKEYATTFFYPAQLVGSRWQISSNKFGLEITISGFNDKLDKFVCQVMQRLVDFQPSKEKLNTFVGIYRNTLESFKSRPLSALLIHFRENILMRSHWSNEELLGSVKSITKASISAILKNLLANCTIECLVHGNVTAKVALETCKKVQEIVQRVSPIIPVDVGIVFDLNRDVHLPDAQICQFDTTNEIHESHGLLIYYQVGLVECVEQAKLELFCQLIHAQFFNIIRMKEQLAYVTFCYTKTSMGGSMGLELLIQSSYTVRYLEERFEAFIESLYEFIKNKTEEEFETSKKALITKLAEKPKFLYSLSNQIWSEISTGQYYFYRKEEMIEHVKKMSKSLMLEFYKQHFQLGKEKCRKLIVGIRSTKDEEKKAISKENPLHPTVNRNIIENIRKFKCEQSLNRLPKLMTDWL